MELAFITRMLFYMGLILMFSSCATVLNSRTKQIDIITTVPAKIIFKKDTLFTANNRTIIQTERKSDPLKITVIADNNSKRMITVHARKSFSYWLNAYPTLILWAGFLIDRKNPKRYTYPGRVYINMSDSSNKYILYDPRSRKGQLYLHVSIPHINSFLLKPDNEVNYKSNTGFWGIALGLDYYHSRKQFINLTTSGVSDFFLPMPAAVDISGQYELMSSSYIGLSNNHRLRNFLLGYGLSFSKNTWDLRYYDRFSSPPPTRNPVKKINNAIGFIFPMYYQLGEDFIVGIIYRPTILRFSKFTPFEYEHLISVDIGWKIALKNN